MYPVTRLIGTILKAPWTTSINPSVIGEVTFRCRPWDLDMFLEMNNGRVLTLYDLGRFDLLLRAGITKTLKKQRWGLVIASCSVRYRRRIRAFEKVTIRTRVAGADDRWVYIAQSMWVGGQPASSVLLRTAITAKGKAIAPSLVLEALGLEDQELQMDNWEQAWIENENQRPWPPSPDISD